MLYEDFIEGYSHGNLEQYKTGKFPPRKLTSKKANSKSVIIETAINQAKAELIGTFSLTEKGRWVFMELVTAPNGNLVCTCPEGAIDVKQVGVVFNGG